MRVSVVIRSKDEADRLRLTLASLMTQSVRPEVVVVSDGSSDHTASVLADASATLDLLAIYHATPAGRSAAANAGAARARGDIVLFLDGDTLAAPDLVARHIEAHKAQAQRVVRGETFHLRCTRFFLDPEQATPQPGEALRVAAMPTAERDRARVTRQQIWDSFADIVRRSQPGIYPGFGPRQLYEMEMRALQAGAPSKLLWAAASGANQSLSRSAFLDAGGFRGDLTINEHRELALRLSTAGLTMAPCAGRSYHMIHRSGWRDPLADHDWEDIFFAAHPLPEVALLPLLWTSFSDKSEIPAAARLHSLQDLATAAARCAGHTTREAVRQAHLVTATAAAETPS